MRDIATTVTSARGRPTFEDPIGKKWSSGGWGAFIP